MYALNASYRGGTILIICDKKKRLISATITLFELISSEISVKPVKPVLRTGANISFTFYTRFKVQMSQLTTQ